MEAVLTLGLVSVILGTASGAQNVGPLRRARRGRLHRSRRPLGKPDLGRVDEPRPHLRARPRRRRLHQLLGLRRRAADRSTARCRSGLDPARPRRRAGRIRRRTRRPVYRGPAPRQGMRPPVRVRLAPFAPTPRRCGKGRLLLLLVLAGAAGEAVATGASAEGVLARLAVEAVVAGAAVEAVVTRAAADAVLAGLARGGLCRRRRRPCRRPCLRR